MRIFIKNNPKQEKTMGQKKKGDKVRYTEWALDFIRKDAELYEFYLRDENLEEVHTISSYNPDTTVFLEGRGEIPYQNYWFERVCVDCQREKVDKFDRCKSCAKTHRDEMYDKVRAALSIDQLALFDEYHKAVRDCESMFVFY
ncbi:MAG: hypothetical protein UR51_C0010G0060 [Candidatus Moranbacteria bacterium GW2011_GWF1_34_10]|nr:MAG: hypothetical protein UR51_C0010G0060 [Candidatus Moranbacteria bacterium GW2011_GWF1_34_10]